MELPSWLPPYFEVSPWSEDTYARLYAVYKNYFIDSDVYYQGRRVHLDRKIEDGCENAFWHITSRMNKNTKQREPDFKRCRCLPWLKPLLENSHRDEVTTWNFIESKGELITYVWLENYDYIAVLKNLSRGGLVLKTAYGVDRPFKAKLHRKYKIRQEK